MRENRSNSDLPPSWRRSLGWVSRADVMMAFRIVGQEIRLKCRRFAANGMTLADACELARRIKDQRDLVHQIADHRHARHARRLLRLNRRLRMRFLELVERHGLDKSVLIVK